MRGKRTKASRRKTSLSLKKYYSNPIVRKRMSELVKKAYSNPKIRKRGSERMKRYWKEHSELLKSPEFLKKMDKSVTRWWHEHPNIRKERSEAVKKLFIKHPEKLKKFLQYGKNSSVPHLKTKQGFLVRSKGERKIANFLFDNKIKSEYEGKNLIFKEEGQICVPDFYLPSSKVYIEFYGGFPAAWKKKVMKNKLYKKHKIPCIFITPTELRDLNNYLLQELNK